MAAKRIKSAQRRHAVLVLLGGALVSTLAAAIVGTVHGGARLTAALDAPVPGPAVEAVAALVATACLCWLSAGALLTLLGELPWRGRELFRRLAAVGAPRCWRTAVLTVAGLGALASPALAGALATSGPAVPPAAQGARLDDSGGRVALRSAAGLDALDGLVLPDRPTGSWRAAYARRAVVVQPGDTLWAISARSLPPGAGTAAIAASCARWYDANAAVIGPDPDLLLPGTRLVAPNRPRQHTASARR